MAPRRGERRFLEKLLCLGFSLACAGVQVAAAEQAARPSDQLEREFQSAVAHYEAKQYAQAQRELEPLVARLPSKFEVNELMGLVYAAQGEDKKATPFLRKAVRLNPRSAAARSTLAANLVRRGQNPLAEAEFKKAVELAPEDYDSNHNLGEFYAHAGKLSAAIPCLEKAQRIDPASYTNGYDLALAYVETQNLQPAGKLIREMLERQDTAELHNLLGEVEEKSGNNVEAAREFERAAHLDPSEKNLFDWGVELLLHQTLEPAIQVFTIGAERYPQSARMQIGLGIALYARAFYDKAVSAFMRASDLTPSDPRPYLFLAKAYNISEAEAQGVTEHLERFTQIEPQNAQARYYYALSLWKGQRGKNRQADLSQIESLLRSAMTLDPAFPEAHLQLGILNADQRKFPEAIQEYQRAIKLQPGLVDAHYRLGQAYIRTGEKARAQEEFEIYERLHKKQMAETERQRNEVKQFIYTMKGDGEGKTTTNSSP
jgi:tetratricopeptide (TPR) repeat protein